MRLWAAIREYAKRRAAHRHVARPAGKDKLLAIGPPRVQSLTEDEYEHFAQVVDRIAGALGPTLHEEECLALMYLFSAYDWKYSDGLVALPGVDCDVREWAMVACCFHPSDQVDWYEMKKEYDLRDWRKTPSQECIRSVATRLLAAGQLDLTDPYGNVNAFP
jgi:hypothetical protein